MTEALQWVGDVADGLALEAEMFSASGPQVALWSAENRALVCPRAYRTRPGFDLAVMHSTARGWPVHQRRTGGGTVPQGPGVLNLSFAVTVGRGFNIEAGYKLITRIIQSVTSAQRLKAHTGATPGSFCDGTWNLSLEGRKFVGTAQRWRSRGGGRSRMLAHALILVEGEIAPGAGAVDAFHEDLGLDPVRSEVHTTLSAALGSDAPIGEAVAQALWDATLEELATLEP
ncbi:hypothetical protein R3X27_13930 [Tropicimonas sp. TH_r6]|uniref:lipoate--protein ligase family protein n=1 Tax=Tropicimonas sp. TH_r6 TaxID=3082085 RepID=UPI002952A35B|nr:hypothetical protein [Tropicimonas sp. TH_r6]MDV7143781.1 hypothetical protein [Tropicimonas sp. TH_r6]